MGALVRDLFAQEKRNLAHTLLHGPPPPDLWRLLMEVRVCSGSATVNYDLNNDYKAFPLLLA